MMATAKMAVLENPGESPIIQQPALNQSIPTIHVPHPSPETYCVSAVRGLRRHLDRRRARRLPLAFFDSGRFRAIWRCHRRFSATTTVWSGL